MDNCTNYAIHGAIIHPNNFARLCSQMSEIIAILEPKTIQA